MFGHYLTTTLRSFSRAPFATATSVLVLSLGLVSFVTAYAVVDYWQMSEEQFANTDRSLYGVGRANIRRTQQIAARDIAAFSRL